jgi:uncharacterized protein YlxW (UPF0749 family)
MQRMKYRPVLAVIVAVLGFMLAMAFNTNARGLDARPERSSSLTGAVRDMEHQRASLQKRLADLRASMSELERKAADEAGMRESFSRELEQARAAAGLTAVSGPGVEVVLADAAQVPAGSDPNDSIVHDYDVASVVNALMNAGAEAVSINGERVVATTAVRCAGNTILVNSTRLGNPYTIRAIGDSAKLEDGVLSDSESSPIFTTYGARYGLGARISRSGSVTVPGFGGSLRPSFARSAKDGGTS